MRSSLRLRLGAVALRAPVRKYGSGVVPFFRDLLAMETFEITILVIVFIGFLGLIAYAARHARSDDE